MESLISSVQNVVINHYYVLSYVTALQPVNLWKKNNFIKSLYHVHTYIMRAGRQACMHARRKCVNSGMMDRILHAKRL